MSHHICKSCIKNLSKEELEEFEGVAITVSLSHTYTCSKCNNNFNYG